MEKILFMNLTVANVMAAELMQKHDLIKKGWKFQFDRSKRRFGVCRHGKKIIGLSRDLTLLNDVDKVKDTILHEIAHAIAGFKAGHGEEWKRICILIGAKPERCYSSDVVKTPELKYYAKCGACGSVHQKARIVRKNCKRSCKCQRGKNWNERILLQFVARY